MADKIFDIEWEEVKTNDANMVTQRAKVLGGWLIRSWSCLHATDFGHDHGLGMGMCMSYIPDLKHTWKLKGEEQ